MTSHNDPENYKKMSVPFANPKAANDAINKFFDMVEAARNECHIQDAHVIVRVGIMHGKKQKAGISSGHFGYELLAAGMCAWSLGQAQERQVAIMEEMARQKDTERDSE